MVNIVCYVLNCAFIRLILKQIFYKLYYRRKPNVFDFHLLSCKCFVYNNGKDNLGQFDAKLDKELFIEYSSMSKTFREHNKRTLQIEESIHIIFDKSPLSALKKMTTMIMITHGCNKKIQMCDRSS